jgi:hypothetical protein
MKEIDEKEINGYVVITFYPRISWEMAPGIINYWQVSLVSDIPTGGGKIANLFIHCIFLPHQPLYEAGL